MRDCPSGDFYNVLPNGLPVKRREASQEKKMMIYFSVFWRQHGKLFSFLL